MSKLIPRLLTKSRKSFLISSNNFIFSGVRLPFNIKLRPESILFINLVISAKALEFITDLFLLSVVIIVDSIKFCDHWEGSLAIFLKLSLSCTSQILFPNSGLTFAVDLISIVSILFLALCIVVNN